MPTRTGRPNGTAEPRQRGGVIAEPSTGATGAVVGAQVSVVGISKRFGATQALDAVSVEIEAGTIHALVGENGAGKSTLGKIIGGVYVADSGVLRVDGHDVGRWNPPAALAAGIATIQQELSLVPARSVAENVFLGIERSTFGVLRGSVLDRYRELDERVGFGLPGDVPVSSLRLADQQKVEIMRALARNARLIVLDEPTSSLSRDESQRLQQLMRDLRSHGRTLVYVSHFLDEVLAVADTVTIMRDGRITRTSPAAAETKDSLVLGMLGRQLEVNFPAAPPVAADAPVVLEARALCGQVPKDVDLRVHAGEIVGLAGLVGSGRTELARMLAGADPITSGELLLDGVVLPRLRPHGAIRRGVVMLPEDRRALGLVMTQNVRENVTLPRLPSFRRNGAVRIGSERSAVRSVIDQLHIVPPDPDGALRNYSGGNQQKTLFGKWTLERPRCIVLDEPTRGVDIGAKRAIYEAIVDVARAGTAVVLISSELEEVLGMAHRTLLMSDGRVIGEVAAGELDADQALARIFAAVDRSPPRPRRRTHDPGASDRERPVPAPAADAEVDRRSLGLARAANFGRRYGVLILIVVLMIVLTLSSDAFLTSRNLLNILTQNAPLAIVAMAGTLVIIAGGFDLSTGAMFAVASVSAAWVGLHHDPVLGLLIAPLVGLALGLVNGFIITGLRVHSFLATLATSLVYGGLAVLITGGSLISLTNDTTFAKLGRGKVGDVSYAIFILAAVFAMLTFLARRMVVGRHIYAVGGNVDAAVLSGVRVQRVRILTFALSGAAAGIGGAISVSRVATGSAQNGDGVALQAIAAIILGGTSVYGGEGAVWRSLAGVMLLALINNGFNILNANPFYKDLTTGAIIVLAVALSAGAGRR